MDLNKNPATDYAPPTNLMSGTFKIPHVNLAFQNEMEKDVIGDKTIPNMDEALYSSVSAPPLARQSSVIPAMPVTYTWENIEAEAEIVQGNIFNRKKYPTIRKRILNNVTGAVQPGEFLAIMGSSGAGKTTLLNCLTFKNSDSLKIKGARLLNGRPVDTDTLARMSGYVQQEDLFIGTLKVEEVLTFQALLRMDKHYKYEERMARVEEVIFEFGLTKCRQTTIGYPERGVKGISGGERKRLAFACEVLTNPSLMFCDEPTSGLDSYMAQNIVQALKNLASVGKAVICTIHQPSSEVFAMFDRILLMSEGRTAFLGPIDEALPFFANQGMPCPPNYNPADFYIFTLAVIPGQEVQIKQKLKQICDNYEASDARKRVEGIIRDQNNRQANGTETMQKKPRSPYKAGWFAQFGAVFWRSWLTIIRDPQILVAKTSTVIFLGLLIALIYQGQSLDVDSVQNIQGVLFLFLTNATWENIFGVINTFTLEVPIFLREHFNGMYRTDVYYLSKTMAELFIYIICPIISVAIPYYAIGLNPPIERFFICAGIIVLITNVATSFGYIISCLAPSPQIAMNLAVPMIIPLFLFGGFFVKNGSVPVYLDWIRYLSWFMYGNEALSVNQWYGVEFNNTNCQYVDFNLTEALPPPLRPDIPHPIYNTISRIIDAFQSSLICYGEDILDQFNFSSAFFLRDIICLGGLIVAFRIIAFFCLLLKSYRKI